MLTDEEKAFMKRHFRLTYSAYGEKLKPILVPRKRSTITAEKLFEIVGEKRARFIIKKCLALTLDKKRVLIQNKGVVDIYCV